MTKVYPFHSIAPNDLKVHHDDSTCTAGKNIKPKNERRGKGGYRKCKICK